MGKAKTYSIVALGCRTNQYEAEALKSQLRALQVEPVKEGEKADICIVNTCTVTDGADASSRHAIREMRRQNPEATIVVTGCMAEKTNVSDIDPHLLVISNFDKEGIVSKLFPQEAVPEFATTQFENHTRAFVKVQDGCNSFCSYCLIPYVRGRSRSRPIENIVREVEGLVEKGFQEIVLTGINVGDFSLPDGVKGLGTLVRAIDAIDGVERIRISSIDPNDIDDSLFDALMSGKHTCPSSHLVLQSGSNAVLKRMNRKYTRQMYVSTVRRFLEERPDYTFTTDIIVGFPQETEKDFEETLQMVRDVSFAKVHIFPYSERPRTRAATYANKVAPEEIKRRKMILHDEAAKAASHLREQFIGKEVTILTEQVDDELGTFGHTEHFLEVYVPGSCVKSNTLLPVRIVRTSEKGLIGEYAS